MALGKALENYLSKQFPPSSTIDDIFKGKDITFLTNEDGDPVILFIGKRMKDGKIKGERYARRLIKKEGSNEFLKSHWDLKGKTG
jgi:hypothetical protein